MLAPLGLIALLFPATAHSQTAGVAGEEGETEEATIVVTANRAPMRLDQVGQSMTVLDIKAIEASQAVGVTELLSQTPGVQFSRNGGPGKSTSLYVRGAETGQTVVLFDGVRLHDPSTTDGGATLADVMVGDIGRIEVLRGAQSTLWGSQAIGGVINIISREPKKPFEADFQAEAGELDTYLARAGLGGKDGGLTWRVGGSFVSSGGVSAYAKGAEPDGYENTTLHGRIKYAIADAVEVDLRSVYTFGRNEYDNFNADAPVHGENGTWLNYGAFSFDLLGRLHNRFAFARTDITRTNYDRSEARKPQPITFDAAGKTDRFEYQGTLDITKGWSAVFGIEHAENDMRTASPTVAKPNPVPISAQDSTTGIYGQVQGEVAKGLTLTGGIRQEDHSTFGGSTVGSASVAWSLNGGDTVLRASWAQGFKAPSLYQLYSQYGNTGLAPEKAESWDIGAEQRIGKFSLSAVYFHRDTENLVQYSYCSANPAEPLCGDGRSGYYANVGNVRAKGVELGASVNFGPLTASANFTYLDAVNTTPGDANLGKKLARRPRENFNATVSYTWPFRLVTSASVRIAGDSFNDAANSQLLKSYTLVDLRLSYPIDDRIELYARTENAFDEKYETITDYSTMPRAAYGGVRLKF
ncbi:hypothetical protein SZ64_09760 [Erythrobacter sp. SG61-1L]|nr:hypothetical protein SZ64_09760 [Erythrobacter sp. SG61-1L]